MSHKHRNVLSNIFKEPVSGNIHWRDIESLMNHLGAKLEHGHGARIRVFLNDIEGTMHRPHKSGVCNKQDIRHLREFLTAAGVSVASYEALRNKEEIN